MISLRLLLSAVLALCVPFANAEEESAADRLLDAQLVTVPTPTDLQSEARAARERGLPLLVMFGSHDCHYCELVERQFLKPMIYSGDYQDRVLIRRIPFDDTTLTGFDGQPTTGRELGRRYGVKVTPTVLFLDAAGEQLVKSMVGVTTPDYYGGYLDEAITAALTRMRQQPTLSASR